MNSFRRNNCVFSILRMVWLYDTTTVLFSICRAGRTSSFVVVHAEYACTRYIVAFAGLNLLRLLLT